MSADLFLYEDACVVAMNKPAGLLVHRGLDRAPVVAMSLARDRVGQFVYPVHRLDRAASGVLLFARSREATRNLMRQFEAGTVRKRYLALVRGEAAPSGVVDHPIQRHPDGPRVPAVTRWRTLHVARLDEPPPDERLRMVWSVVEVFPESGRMHQIRRHLKHAGHPLIGDVKYGRSEHNHFFRDRFGLRRLALHAADLAFDHPDSGDRVELHAPLTEDLAGVLRALGWITE